MKIEDYLSLVGISRTEFAARIKATPEAVRLWGAGERVPSRNFMVKIFDETRGAVTANDFYGLSASPEEARGQ